MPRQNGKEQKRTRNRKRKKKAMEGNDGYSEEDRNDVTDKDTPPEDKLKSTCKEKSTKYAYMYTNKRIH